MLRFLTLLLVISAIQLSVIPSTGPLKTTIVSDEHIQGAHSQQRHFWVPTQVCWQSKLQSKEQKIFSFLKAFAVLTHRRADRAPQKLLKQELDLSEQREFSSSQQF